jgi:hypothetical protein
MVPTVTRKPRMQRRPPITAESCVILSRTSIAMVYRYAGCGAILPDSALKWSGIRNNTTVWLTPRISHPHNVPVFSGGPASGPSAATPC